MTRAKAIADRVSERAAAVGQAYRLFKGKAS